MEPGMRKIQATDKQTYILTLGSAAPLDELNEDWRIVEQTAFKITLEHISGGNGDTDRLILERN
jgi:hypothetical protein